MVTSPHLSGHPGSDRAGSDGVADDSAAAFTGEMMSIRSTTNASFMANNEVCWPPATAAFLLILVLRSRWFE